MIFDFPDKSSEELVIYVIAWYARLHAQEASREQIQVTSGLKVSAEEGEVPVSLAPTIRNEEGQMLWVALTGGEMACSCILQRTS
jgi:hypothetical protein